MESLGVGAFPEGEWESFSKMFSAEELDFTPQFLLGHDQHAYDHQDQNSLLYSLGNINSNLQFISQERSYCGSHENYYFGDAKHVHIPVVANDICVMDEKIINIGSFFPAFPDIVMGDDHDSDQTVAVAFVDDGGLEDIAISGNELVQKRKFDVPECRTKEEDKTSKNTGKKPQASRNAQKSKRNVKSKKNVQKTSQLEEESNGQSSSGCSSDDDNANSQETNGGATSDSKDSAALNLSGKMRASRGSATDPQSLYARKRRERINERLRILQGLVPNGTKVDISTMLEEAVHYVKFLQLQIKLLSSDEMWMYAPIAYNGMDIGLISQKISPPL